MKRSPLTRRTPLKPISDRKRAAQKANAAKRVYERRGEMIVCQREGCGREFYVRPSEIGKRKFCSRACQGLTARTRTCAVCGGELAGVVQIGVKTCPKPACRKEIRARSKRGDRNPMAGPRASRKREWYASKEARCRLCPNTTNLKLHHVVYEQHVRKYGGDIYDPRNGLTLCMTCHNHHHHDADGRLSTNDMRPENIEFAFELLGPYAADYFVRYYDDDSGGALMARALEMQAAAC